MNQQKEPEAGRELVVSGMIQPVAKVTEVLNAFEQYQELKTKLGTEADFTVIKQKAHPNKSFVRKIEKFFGLSVEPLKEEPVVLDGSIVAWIVTARAFDHVTGRSTYADGACEMSEKDEKQRTIHNIRAHAHTRAKNRAILDLVGFGDVSAEEIIDDKRAKHSQDAFARGADTVIPKGEFAGQKIRDLPTATLAEFVGDPTTNERWRGAFKDEIQRREELEFEVAEADSVFREPHEG